MRAGPGRQNQEYSDHGGVISGDHRKAQADRVRHLGGVSAMGGLQSKFGVFQAGGGGCVRLALSAAVRDVAFYSTAQHG